MTATLRARARQLSQTMLQSILLADAQRRQEIIESALLRYGAECVKAEPTYEERKHLEGKVGIDWIEGFRAMAAERAKSLEAK